MAERKPATARGRIIADIAVAMWFVTGFAVIIFSYYASFLGLPLQVALAVFTLIASGMAVRGLKSLKGGYGIYMIGGRRGISTVDGISKRNPSFWKAMPMWGMVLGFGLLAYPMFRRQISWKMLLLGIATIVVMLYATLPCIGLAFQFIKIPQIQNAVGGAMYSCQPSFSGLTLVGAIIYVLTVISGFSGFIIVSLVYNAASIFSNSIAFALSSILGHPQTSLLSSQLPGVAPVIPGIDIPLVAGIASLAIILIIHEFSHGILARISRIRLKSIGLLLFGVIPVGAFVEPDEKAVEKLSKVEQNRISAAGISSNFIATLVFFALTFLMFTFIVPGIYQNRGVFIQAVAPNTPANGILQPGMQILSWNGHQVTNLTNAETASQNDVPGSIINVVVLSPSCYPPSNLACIISNYSIPAVSINGSARGYIGIAIVQKVVVIDTAYAKTMYFLYSLFALSFILNFLVAIVNLLPIPGFDGFRLYKTNVRSLWLIKFVEALIIIALLLNVLPWLYIGLLH